MYFTPKTTYLFTMRMQPTTTDFFLNPNMRQWSCGEYGEYSLYSIELFSFGWGKSKHMHLNILIFPGKKRFLIAKNKWFLISYWNGITWDGQYQHCQLFLFQRRSPCNRGRRGSKCGLLTFCHLCNNKIYRMELSSLPHFRKNIGILSQDNRIV